MTSSIISENVQTPPRPFDPQRLSVDEMRERLVATLTERQSTRQEFRPITVDRLIALAGFEPTQPLKAAVNGPKFSKAVIVPAKSKGKGSQFLLQAPVCLIDDLPRLVESNELLEFAFLAALSGQQSRVARISDLKNALRATRDLHSQFQQALKERMAAGELPSWLGWLEGGRTRYLFRMADIQCSAASGRMPFPAPDVTRPSDDASQEPAAHQPIIPAVTTQRPSSVLESQPSAPSVPQPPVHDFAAEFEAAFDRLNRQQGNKNFITLHDLRRSLPHYDRPTFDAGIHQLRRERRFTLDSSDGNFVVVTDAEREAAIREGGSILVYCSRR